MIECVPSGDVVDQKCTCRSSVVGSGDWSECFLASLQVSWMGTAQSYSIKSQAYRVPNLQLDLLTLDVDHSCPKLHPNSQVMHLGQVSRSQPSVQTWNARREAWLLIIDQVSLTGWKRLSVNCRSKQDLPTPDWLYAWSVDPLKMFIQLINWLTYAFETVTSWGEPVSPIMIYLNR